MCALEIAMMLDPGIGLGLEFKDLGWSPGTSGLVPCPPAPESGTLCCCTNLCGHDTLSLARFALDKASLAAPALSGGLAPLEPAAASGPFDLV